MLGAHPEYGAFVNPSKTLVNFDTSVGGVKINRPVDIDEFPYCGILLNTRNLDISKDTTKLIRAGMDWLTKVEYSKMPQQALRRKARQALQMQSHRMYFETEYNNFTTVLKNLYHNFTQAAHKVYYGAKVLKVHYHQDLLQASTWT
ncbi:uncharacterized protein LAJ45_10539 [Morchella importuna]|uniref:uncharacterized protein n=1 Tax=Morchella importuna TaxID=1174673 RepID=UPI001E8E40FB|nr:uncharacterized protein LAJ45_10539 [Morchella importuna]KAH8145417.1 hypothetical protein LAJ45_10539 [Morchella importuna]